MSLPDPAPARRGPRDRGAVLVHVAVATMGLLAFSALSIDLGTLWVARAQAQNAADAAALAGGVALAYIDETDVDAARAAANTVAQAHTVWGAPVAPAEVTTTVGACPSGSPSVAGACMGVVVSRNAASGTPLPGFFSRMFGATGNEMHASASAKVMIGNAAACPRPLAIVDRWNDLVDTTGQIDAIWTTDDVYDGYAPDGTPVGPSDVYTAPTAGAPGSGWTLAQTRPSQQLTFRLPVALAVLPTALGADQLISFDLPRTGGDANVIFRYRQNLESCTDTNLAIGQQVPMIVAHRNSYTAVPLAQLVDQDLNAVWDESAQAVRGSLFPISPRLIKLAVIDPDSYSRQDRSAGVNPTLDVRNLVGFFLEQVEPSQTEVVIRGRIARTAGMYDGAAPAITDQASFLRTVALVR